MSVCCPYCHQAMVDAPPQLVIDNLHLPNSERRILEQLFARIGMNTRTEVLINALYGLRPDGGPLTAMDNVRIFIFRLRKKLPENYQIENVRGFGYRLEVAP